MPPEYVAHEAVAGVGEPELAEHGVGRVASRAARPWPNSRATITRFSRPVSAGSTAAACPASPMTRRTVVGVGDGVDAGDVQRAAVGGAERGDGADERRLAGAVRAEHGGDDAGRGDEVETVEGGDGTELLAQPDGLDRRLLGAG